MQKKLITLVNGKAGAFARFSAFTYKCVYDCLGRITSSLNKYLTHTGKTLCFLGIYSLFFNFLLEASLRKNIFTGFLTLFTSPVAFLVNTLFIFSSFTLIFLFKRRLFVLDNYADSQKFLCSYHLLEFLKSAFLYFSGNKRK